MLARVHSCQHMHLEVLDMHLQQLAADAQQGTKVSLIGNRAGQIADVLMQQSVRMQSIPKKRTPTLVQLEQNGLGQASATSKANSNKEHG